MAVLRAGGVVAYPTDTLYGLAADPRSERAVARIFALKGRAETSALPLIAADLEQAREAGTFDPHAESLAERWWPGPLTIVVPARPGLAAAILAGGNTVAVRVPAHDVARALARQFGACITSTSANRSGTPPVSRAADVVLALPELDAIVDGGQTTGGPPSTIVEVQQGRVRLVRDGAIAWSRVLESQQ